MDYKVLYRKYRPSCFDDVVGQDNTIRMLKNSIVNNMISHAYIFTGPRGTGKTSTAKIFAKTINCLNPNNGEACGKCENCLNFSSNPDIIEIDAASNNGVDDIRELIDNMKIAPTQSRYKVYIIDEVHMMTTNAFNALLLTLEEPPQHAIFILATTNVESVPITILSRCQRFNFRKLKNEDIISQIRKICNLENIKIEDEAIKEIAYDAEGGMRDALSLLDQLSSCDEMITLEKILDNYGSLSGKFIDDIILALENKDINKLEEYFEELENSSSDYKILIKKLTEKLMKIAISIKIFSYNGNLKYKTIKEIIFNFNEILNKINININPYSMIKLVLLDSFNDNSKNSVEVVEKINDNPKNINIEKINIQNDDTKEINNEEFLKIKKQRINNCFAGAKKDIFVKYKNIWNNLKNDFNLPPEFLSLVVDSDIVAASIDYCILTCRFDTTVDLINSKLKELELVMKDKFNESINFICLSESEWNIEKSKYITNLKKNYKYEIISDVEEHQINNNDVEIVDVFQNDKVEIV